MPFLVLLQDQSLSQNDVGMGLVGASRGGAGPALSDEARQVGPPLPCRRELLLLAAGVATEGRSWGWGDGDA